jgi:hypothetical protein
MEAPEPLRVPEEINRRLWSSWRHSKSAPRGYPRRLTLPRGEFGRVAFFVADARKHRQLGVTRESPVGSRKFAQHEPAALAAHDLPGVPAGGAEATLDQTAIGSERRA